MFTKETAGTLTKHILAVGHGDMVNLIYTNIIVSVLSPNHISGQISITSLIILIQNDIISKEYLYLCIKQNENEIFGGIFFHVK